LYKQDQFFGRQVWGVVACLIAYILILTFAPANAVGIVAQFAPILLIAGSLYLVICGYFSSVRSPKACYISEVFDSYSKSLTLWLALSLLLIGSQLVYVWSGEVLNHFYIGGLLPHSDAANYYSGARRLLIEGDLTNWSSRRPMMTVYIAALLGITGFSLVKTISIMAAIAALGIALTSAALRKTEPPVVALWALLLMFLFYNGIAGTMLSENLGLALGCLAFVCLWAAAGNRRLLMFLAGVFLMTLAQITRSGAVLVLPLLVFWGAFWIASDIRTRMIVIFGGCTVIFLGLSLNKMLLIIGGGNAEIAFSNFSDTLYGLSVGSGWRQISLDYPDMAALSEPVRSQNIYKLSFDNIINQPVVFIGSLLNNLKTYVITGGGMNMVAGTKAWLLVQIPSLLGIFWCFRFLEQPRYALLLIVIFGVLLSATIITEDGGLRVFAATVPFTAAIAALGLRWLYIKSIRRYTESNNYYTHTSIESYGRFAAMTGGLLVIALLIAIGFGPLKSVASSQVELVCRPGLKSVVIRYPARTAIHLNDATKKDWHYSSSQSLEKLRDDLWINDRVWPELTLNVATLSLIRADQLILMSKRETVDDPKDYAVCVEKNSWLYVSEDLL
jgi:hypothetical protein